MEFTEYQIKIAIENIELKIAKAIKNNKEKNFKKLQQTLNDLIEDKEKIYNLDINTIKKYSKGVNSYE